MRLGVTASRFDNVRQQCKKVFYMKDEFADAYRNFQILQDLDHAGAARCDNPDCPGVGADGTVLSIKKNLSCIQRHDWFQDTSSPPTPSFQEHIFLKQQSTRDMLIKYAILI